MTQLDPVAEFNGLKPNCKAHAVYWLRTGELHPEAHYIIVARLTPWIARVTAVGGKSSTNCGRKCSPSGE